MVPRSALVVTVLAAAAALAPTTQARPEVGMPREIVTGVGEQDGIRLMSNAAKRWHWTWLRRPSARIVRADPPQMLPENDEAVNGLSGRTSVTVTGRRPGTTSGVVGYWNADESRLLKTVRIRIVVE